MSRQVLLRESEDKKIRVYIDTDTSLAVYHDFVLKEKGWAVDRMVAIHNEQLKEAEEKISGKIDNVESPVEESQPCATEECAKE